MLLVITAILSFANSAMALNDAQQLVVESWRLVNQSYVDSSKFEEIHWKKLRQKALEKTIINSEQAYEAIEKMLLPLGDPYTKLLRPNDYLALKSNTQGNVSGVGIQLGARNSDSPILVIAPLQGSPAAKAGLISGTEIIEINGESVENLSLEAAAGRLRGQSGTQVIIKAIVPNNSENSFQPFVKTNHQNVKEFILNREQIDLNPVRTSILTDKNKKIGYIYISQFSENVSEQMTEALNKLNEEGIQELILDLRNNSGGLVSAGLEVANQLLGNGSIVETVNREGISEIIQSSRDQLFTGSMVTIVNGGTASAGEILAGALQDNGRSKLIGNQTFGKGLIQSLINLGDGSGLTVTVARYMTPKGRDIQKLGITPDYLLASPEPLNPGEAEDSWIKDAQILLEKAI
uniref:PDZ domain (Also known as DHR or GLGF):Tail specific protease n=1 Tax=Paulinella longichromatophora TaxID=1708747 RepID=A0A2H4ZQ40_9EUKA|nr:PDZ domain (also known as DHR or GLGF):Tail specific protease [Paulinella longichromatophora]